MENLYYGKMRRSDDIKEQEEERHERWRNERKEVEKIKELKEWMDRERGREREDLG